MPLNFGLDASGNGNNWIVNNISQVAGSTYDSMLDVPSGNGYADGGNGRGNYCVLNPLDISGTTGTYASGNLNFTKSTAGNAQAYSSFQVTSGKWYCEVTMGADIAEFVPGIIAGSANAGANRYLGQDSFTYAYYNNGQKINAASYTAYGNSYTTGNVIGIILDADNGKLYFSKDGVVQNSGDPVGGTGFAFSGLTGPYRFAASAEAGGTSDFNFGQRPFSYTPPTGFKALNTTNLPEPTVKKGSSYFNPVLYTGNGSYDVTVTNTFASDLVWLKSRSNAENHYLQDIVRGFGASKSLSSNTTGSEGFNGGSPATQNITTTSTSLRLQGQDFTQNTYTYVAWNWKANGTGVSNTAGTITSTVSANTTSGFSIVTWTGNGSASATVGHGLGVAPSMVIAKERTGTDYWHVWHTTLPNQQLYLNVTNAAVSITSGAPGPTDGGLENMTTSTFGFKTSSGGNVNSVNENGILNVAYCFAAIPGYSAFGKYTGNGSTDGPFVYCGFRPRFILVKSSSGAFDWHITDTSRSTYNQADTVLFPNSSAAETNGGGYYYDLLSNGFKCRNLGSATNGSGATYIYAAFAENPLKFSNAR